MVVKKLTLIAACITTVLLSVAFCSASEWTSLDPVMEALLEPDGTQVEISPVFVDSILGDYIIVRDVMVGSVPIPVYVGEADITLSSTVSIWGRLATVEFQSRRVLIADDISVYTMSDGMPSPPVPWLDPETWPYMSDVPMSMDLRYDSMLPLVPDLPAAETAGPTSAPGGTVAAVKIGVSDQRTATRSASVMSTPPQYTIGHVSLTDKIVSASFPDFFYIEEADRSCGILVVPTSPIQVQAGELVDIEGEVIPSSSSVAECYLLATFVTHSGWADVPGSLGIPQRMLVGGEFGQQQALYQDTISTPALAGCGLNPVGLRIKAWGLETSYGEDGGGNDFVYLDDGSGLKPTSSATGLKVVSWEDCTLPTTQGTNYYSADGILGAEMGANTLPVPVVRVPCPHFSISIANPPGEELHVISGATVVISGHASATGTGVASVQVKIGAGTYQDVTSYDRDTHIWTYDWQSPSDATIYAKVTDYYGNSMETAPRSIIVSTVGVIYVKPGGTGDGTLSWDNACASVNTAIITADACNPKSEVWVATGTYTEADGRCTLKDGVAVYGGFFGNEDARELRNWTINPTVLDGGNTSPSVVTAPTGVTTSAQIDGFIITGGRGTYESSQNAGFGGGVYCNGGSPTISNNRITLNSFWSTYNYYYGAGIACRLGASPIICSNIIIDNELSSGVYSSSSSPTISNNIISGHSSIGVYTSNSTATITGNAISGNTKGGISISSSSPTTVTGNKVVFNGNYGITCYFSPAMIIGNVIAGNVSGVKFSNVTASTATVTNNTIIENTSYGMYCYNSQINLSNNIIAFHNTGVYNAGSYTPTLRNNDVYNPTGTNYTGLSEPPVENQNMSADPDLAGLAYGYVRPQSGSPCIDAGWNDAQGLPLTDIEGQDRKQDGDGNGSVIVDIGACESDGSTYADAPDVIVHVSTSGNDTNDGSTWIQAKRTVQAGINAAFVTGGEVWVASGTYTEHVIVPPSVSLYGGFAGVDETSRDERDWLENRTIIDGSDSNVFDATDAVKIIGSTHGVFDGFTICNAPGRGLYINGGSPTISHNVVEDNLGGGIYCNNSAPVISNNKIRANTVAWESGAGIYCGNSCASINNNLIECNAATEGYVYGGGIYCAYSPSRIANNTIIHNEAVNGGGIYCYYSPCSIINNTIAHNFSRSLGGGGIYLYYSDATVSNTISFNNINPTTTYTSTEITVSNSPLAFFQYNDVYGQNLYGGISDQTGVNNNISVDPLLDGVDHVHIGTALDGNDCKDKGLNDVVETGDLDTDGQTRTVGTSVDIGADEIPDCVASVLSITPASEITTPSASVEVTAHVCRSDTQAAISDCQVDFKLTSNGRIESVSSGQMNSLVSATGVTDEYGDTSIVITSADGSSVGVKASIVDCGRNKEKSCSVSFGEFKCGLAYALCGGGSDGISGNDLIEQYLQRETQTYTSIEYCRLGSIEDFETVSACSCNTLIVAYPVRPLTVAELSCLKSLIDSGRMKRVVFCGEYTSGLVAEDNAKVNSRLNSALSDLGIDTRFQWQTTILAYDSGDNLDRVCSVEQNHYLTQSGALQVVGLWDNATNIFSVNPPSANPVAYIYGSTEPWVLEEDTATDGSIVLVHDCNLFDPYYNDTNDTVPDKNFLFVHNLCTVFPQ